MTYYLTPADVLAIDQDLIARYSGSPGLRDPGLLESALFRPRTGYYHDSLAEAAALWESVSQNHPFVDGNKRISFAAAYTFLAINGRTIVADPLEAFAFIDGLFKAGTFGFEELDLWLRAHVR